MKEGGFLIIFNFHKTLKCLCRIILPRVRAICFPFKFKEIILKDCMLFLHINSGGKLLHIYCDKKQTNFKN